MKPRLQPSAAVPPVVDGDAADWRPPTGPAGANTRTFTVSAGPRTGKSMTLSYLLAEKEELSTRLASMRAAQEEIRGALATFEDASTMWSLREPLEQSDFAFGSFRYTSDLQPSNVVDVGSFFLHEAGKDGVLTDVLRFFPGPALEDESSLTPHERARRALLRQRLALAAFLGRVLKNRLKIICRRINLILRGRTAQDERRSVFAREIPLYLQHGCHPPAAAGPEVCTGLVFSGTALI